MPNWALDSVDRILLWRQVMAWMTADNKRTSLSEKSNGKNVKTERILCHVGEGVCSPVWTEKGQRLFSSLLIFGDRVELWGICISALSLRGS